MRVSPDLKLYNTCFMGVFLPNFNVKLEE